MTKPVLLLGLLLITGCVSASPIDWMVPTPVNPIATNYLGHTKLPNINFMFHSLKDTKIESRLFELRKLELDALYNLSVESNKAIIATYDPISDGLWSLLILAAGGLGLSIPKPGTKARVNEALHQEPPR